LTESEAWLALNAAELPPRTTLDLLDHYGAAAALMSASPSAVASAGRLRPAEIARFAEAQQRDYSSDVETLGKLNVRFVTIRDSEYPPNLRQIYDPPAVLFVRGSFQPRDERAVAIVGTRRVTPYGRLVSETLGRDLAARAVTVVSGLAVGADAAAHRGALTAGGRTIGVLACGIDVPYPRDTLELREQAVGHGAVVSDLPLGTPARPARFHARNRIVSGLCLGVVVTEAPESSGALITANHAANQGRQVFAVPGSINSEFSLPEFAPAEEAQPGIREPAPSADLAPDERSILDALSLQQRHVDEIIQQCELPSSRASAGLLMLELKGLVRRLPGNMFMRVR
jgi:DNA processing protein